MVQVSNTAELFKGSSNPGGLIKRNAKGDRRGKYIYFLHADFWEMLQTSDVASNYNIKKPLQLSGRRA